MGMVSRRPRLLTLMVILLLGLCSLLVVHGQPNNQQVALVTDQQLENMRRSIAELDDSFLDKSAHPTLQENLSPKQAKVNTIQRSLLRLPELELRNLELDLDILRGGEIDADSAFADALIAAFEERQLLLKDAMKSMVKPAEYMANITTRLTRDFETSDESFAFQELFLELEDLLSDIDNARDFHTLGLWPLLTSRLHNSFPHSTRALAAETIGAAINSGPADYQLWLLEPVALDIAVKSPNNAALDDDSSKPAVDEAPVQQTHRLVTTPLHLLIEMLEVQPLIDGDLNDGDSFKRHQQLVSNVQRKALYALSAGLRGNVDLQAALFDRDYADNSGSETEQKTPVLLIHRVVRCLQQFVTRSSLTNHLNQTTNGSEQQPPEDMELARKVFALAADSVDEYLELLGEFYESVVTPALHTLIATASRASSAPVENNNTDPATGATIIDVAGNHLAAFATTESIAQQVVASKDFRLLRQAVAGLLDVHLLGQVWRLTPSDTSIHPPFSLQSASEQWLSRALEILLLRASSADQFDALVSDSVWRAVARESLTFLLRSAALRRQEDVLGIALDAVVSHLAEDNRVAADDEATRVMIEAKQQLQRLRQQLGNTHDESGKQAEANLLMPLLQRAIVRKDSHQPEDNQTEDEASLFDEESGRNSCLGLPCDQLQAFERHLQQQQR